jgi:orotidine-5'-phosphate decarboxylase
MSDFDNPIFCALDTVDLDHAVKLAGMVKSSVGGLKVGMELFYAHGTDGYSRISDVGLPVFLDLKLHDIPNTVAGAIRALAPLKPALMTLHCSGGAAMMQAAKAELAQSTDIQIRLIGVTVLTSLDDNDLNAMNITGTTEGQAGSLARLARNAGLDGCVCSPQEVESLRHSCGDDFLLVVPGIRPRGSAAGDQKRTLTPREAVDKGADILVIGRPITQSPDPAAAARAIVDMLE